ECRPHPLRRGHVGDRTHGPFRGDPFTRRVSKHSCETNNPGIFVNCGGLDCCDLMPAQALADNVPDRSTTGRSGSWGLLLGGRWTGLSQQATSPDWSVPLAPWQVLRRWCRWIHWSGAWLPSTLRTSKLTAPDFDRLARMPWPIASLASSGI